MGNFLTRQFFILKNKIIKSPALQKEIEYKEWLERKKKVTTQLKKSKTTLSNLQEKITTFQRETANVVFWVMDINNLRKEVKALISQLQKVKTLSKTDKKTLKGLKNDFIESDDDDMFGEMDMEELIRQRNERDTDEFNRRRSKEMFEQFRVPLKKEEQNNLRKIYLQLATQFHPDKAKDEKETEVFNELMQRINAANERGDVEELLQIMATYADYQSEAPPESKGNVLVDFYEQQLGRTRHEIKLLEQQLSRIKSELSTLQASDIGVAYKQSVNSWEPSPSSPEAIRDYQNAQKMFATIRDSLKEFLETEKKPSDFDSLMNGSHPIFKDFPNTSNVEMDDDDADYDDDDLVEAFKIMLEDLAQSQPRKRRKKK